MDTFITGRIEEAAKISLADGQNKYRAYFIKTNLYESRRANVDAMLLQDGFGNCIVTA